MSVRILLAVLLAAGWCSAAASVASAQCASYTAAPGPATFISGVTDSTNHTDDGTTNITLPFSFTFYGNAYTSANVGSNGFIDFTTAHGSGFYSNACLPTPRGTTDLAPASFGPTIFAHWDDLRTDGAGQGIFTDIVGAAPNRTFIIEWRCGFYSACTGVANFAVHLHEGTSTFDIVYADGGSCGGTSATTGVQQTGTGPFSQFSCNTAATSAGTSIRYTCVPPSAGACCDGSGGCTATEPGACSGTFTSVGTPCSPTNPCGGACCTPSFTCTASTSAGCGAGSVFLNGALCAPSPCPMGACCADFGGACTTTLSATCPSGSTFYATITCSPTPCIATGTCCHSITGACNVFYGGLCPGVYNFDVSTTCTPPPCPEIAWACCLADGSCLTRFQNQCGTLSGLWNPGGACGTFVCSGSTNLVSNPGGETSDMSGWTITANGGNGWSATFDDIVRSGARAFSTSFGVGERNQLIDLVAAGHLPAFLDTAPTIVAGEWVASRFDQGIRYYVRIELVGADQSTVIAFFEHGTPAALIAVPANTAYFQEAMSFTGYGPGVRYVRFKDGGRDQANWAGNYGAHFDDAFVSVLTTSACCTGTACSAMTMADCITGGGAPGAAGTTCSPSPCGGATGVCCRGATCNTTISQANCTVAAGTAGASFVTAGACNSGGSSTTPCCLADYNKLGGVSVTDIFAFLTDWFASRPAAVIGGDGFTGSPSVSNIFAFLTAWFAGGC